MLAAAAFLAAILTVPIPLHGSSYGEGCGRHDLAPVFLTACRDDTIVFVNPNLETCTTRAEEFHVGLPGGAEVAVRVRQPGLVSVRCEVHNAALGWLLVLD